jgi:hypothetical protein
MVSGLGVLALDRTALEVVQPLQVPSCTGSRFSWPFVYYRAEHGYFHPGHPQEPVGEIKNKRK